MREHKGRRTRRFKSQAANTTTPQNQQTPLTLAALHRLARHAVDRAGHVHLEHDRVALARRLVGAAPLEQRGVEHERHEAEAVRQHLVLHDRRVVDEEDVLDRDGRHLGDEDAAQRVGDGGVDADEVEREALGGELRDGDAQAARPGGKVPGVVDAERHVVARARDGRRLFFRLLVKCFVFVWS